MVDDGATLDLKGYSFTGSSALASLTLNNGKIASSGATIAVTGLINVGYGEIRRTWPARRCS